MSELTTIAKGISAGSTIISKSAIYRALSNEAMNRRRDGESAQQAFSKLVTGDPVGRELMAIHQELQRRCATSADPTGPLGKALTQRLRKMVQPGSESGDGGMRDTPEAEMDDDADDGPSFSELVDQHQAKFPKMSRSSSIDHVMTTKEGRRAMQVEKTTRLRKAIGY
jgi:hypothetical protein